MLSIELRLCRVSQNERMQEDVADDKRLKKSLKAQGQQTPIQVEMILDLETCYGVSYVVLDGVRRVKALRGLKQEYVSASIVKLTVKNPDDNLPG